MMDGPRTCERLEVDTDSMTKHAPMRFALKLQPLRRDPHLAESLISGLKWTLGAMFEDPFPAPDIIVAVREVADNLLTHADWNQKPAPSFAVQYRIRRNVPQLRISSTNVVKDIDEAERALGRIRECICNESSAAASLALTAQLRKSAGIRSSGGIGLLQVASSPRSHLEGALFHVRVDVDVPALKSAPNV
ncbi:MAG: hypothetical protein WBN15_14925 [Polyangiales bacterium]|jgi:hypothetical protein